MSSSEIIDQIVYEVNKETLNTSAWYDYDYNYSFLLYFERKYYTEVYVTDGLAWIRDRWWLSILYSLAYIVLVHAGQSYMKNREKFHLYRSLIAWNIVLALFSIAGAVRFLPSFVTVLYNKGFEHSVCVLDYSYGVAGCWAWLFVLSKFIELIDTAFIVLRKQKLIFLHWYHHATVLIYCWYSMQARASSGRWFIAMNYTIHSLMYSYYACRALRYTIPKFVNIIITTLQISQMFVGILINLVAYFRKQRGEPCDVSYDNIYWSFFMYFTYFVLFFNFFINAYLKKSSAQQSQSSTSKKPVLNGINKSSLSNGHSETNGKIIANGNGYHYTNGNGVHHKSEKFIANGNNNHINNHLKKND